MAKRRKSHKAGRRGPNFSNKAVLIMLVLVVFVTVVSLVFYLGALQKAGLGLTSAERAVSIHGETYTSPEVIREAEQSEASGVVSLTIAE